MSLRREDAEAIHREFNERLSPDQVQAVRGACVSYAISDFEYMWIKCLKCDDRVKVAKFKGYPKLFDFLSDFLTMHSGCDLKDIVLEFSDT